MQKFRFKKASSVAEARKMLASNKQARLIAGGTTLVDLMKLNVERPTELIDINSLPLATVSKTASGGVRIGAMVRNSDLAHHDLIRTQYPVLSEALLAGASGQIRNMATVGGNLLQRTRCYYFRDATAACNKRTPGSGCAALDGYHRIHAVLGTSESCIAAHPSDMCVALTSLEAVVEVEGDHGPRRIPIADFYLLPGKTPQKENVLAPGEIVTAVELPAADSKARGRYLKLRDRASYEFALVSVAAVITMDAGIIRRARIAFGGVGTRPWRAPEVEAVLTGKPADPKTLAAATEKAVAGANPRRDNRFKVEMLKAALTRSVFALAEVME